MKEMTFLLYANGHNELEPETWQSVLDIQNSSIGKQINVAVQVSREEQPIVKLLRPNMQFSSNDLWSGVRRYLFTQEQQNVFYELENINMADPNSLYDFIVWGVTNYPALKYVLSISGHIYQFVGICPDYSGKQPLMMGFPEISACIQMAFEAFGANLDILVLDTCYASTVEILYELAGHEHPCIKHVLTYIGKGPLGGLAYSNLIAILEGAATLPIKDVLSRLVSQISINRRLYGLIALQVNHEILELIKQLFCKLVSTYLSYQKTHPIELTPEELLSNIKESYPWSLYLKPIHKLLGSLVVAIQAAENNNKNVLPIHILYQKIPDEERKKLYCRLSFSKQSDWAALLCNIPLTELCSSSKKELTPIPITKNILAAFIYAGNEHISDKDRANMVEKLIEKKNW